MGYTLTREGTAPQTKKVHAILAVKPPTNVRQLRQFLGMVKYYQDIWRKQSAMLSPLTELVGQCGQTKTTKEKWNKKMPWHWDAVHQKAFDKIKATIPQDIALAYPE